MPLLVLLPLLAWRVYARFRRMVGRQRLSRVRPWITLAGYYLAYAVGLIHWRSRVMRAKRARDAAAAGA